MRQDDYPLPPPPLMQRPGHSFICGRSPDETPCVEGPSRSGQCPCATGGSAKGSGEACTPRRTWAGRRRQIARALMVGLAVLMVTLFATRLTPRVVQPGNLSSAHAQILKGTLNQDRCVACHQNATTDGWFDLAPTSDHVAMTDLCLNCHENEMPRQSARWAHNLSPGKRAELTFAAIAKRDGNRDSLANDLNIRLVGRGPAMHDDLACSVCHQEHHGADANLAAITDARCQTCHVSQFGSFADSHPEFGDWPYEGQASIAFDHGRHASIHYPKEAEKSGQIGTTMFDCKSCHLGPTTTNSIGVNTTDPVMTTLPYEIACARCHDETLRVQIANGPALIQFPTLPDVVARRIEQWPAQATGFADGAVDGWTALLLRGQNENLPWRRFRQMDRVDFTPLIVQNEAVRVGEAMKQLVIEVAMDGQSTLMQRMKQSGIAEPTAQLIAESFPPQLMRDALASWFGKQAAPSSATRTPMSSGDGLFGDSLGGTFGGDDALLGGGDPLASWATPVDEAPAKDVTVDWQTELAKRYDAATIQPLGGWYRDDVTLSLRYRGKGHSDVVLRAMIETISQLPDDDPVKQSMSDQPALVACTSCHVPPTSGPMRWTAGRSKQQEERLTHFSHTPHLNIQGIQDCVHCHALSVSTNPVDAADLEMTTSITREFEPLTTATCAACHTPKAAGDHCVMCHRYHVHDGP